MNIRIKKSMLAGLLAMGLLAGCSPEVGSEKWCAKLSEKPKGDWTASEAADYAAHCLIPGTEEE